MGSIVDRLRAHFRRHRLFGTLSLDFLAFALVFLTWVLTTETTLAGQVAQWGSRRLSLGRGLLSLSPGDWFQGANYTFRAGETTYHANAAPVLCAILCTAAVLLAAQFFFGLLSSRAEGQAIRAILRPIDDVALTAERLSSLENTGTADAPAVCCEDEKADRKKRADRTHGDLAAQYRDLAVALDHIDSNSLTGARVTVPDRELAGLEAAVNNMLRRLAEANRRQSRFVDDASHELRTPIAVIQGYVQMLERWGKDDPAVRDEAIEAIRTETEHMKTLVEQLLFLARGESDRLPLARTRLDAGEMMQELWEESRMIDTAHTYEYPPPPAGESLPIFADEALWKQCLRTLLDNARKFTPAGGTISLRAFRREADGEVVCEVADTGAGIPAEELPRIFDRLYRGSAARSGISGSGLGLSIAKWITDRHGGRIDVVSAPGVGTKFSVILPVYRETGGGDGVSSERAAENDACGRGNRQAKARRKER